MLLAGDIGGTKTNLAVFSPEAGWRAPLVEKTFPSSQYPSLEAIVHEFLAQEQFSIDPASFGVAGPVVGGQATITNLPCTLDEQQLQAPLNIPSVHLLNSLPPLAPPFPFLRPPDRPP